MEKNGTMENRLAELYREIDLSTLLNKVAAYIRKYLGCDEATIFLYNPTKQELYFEISTSDKMEVLQQIVLKKGEGVVGWVAKHEIPVIINDCAKDPRFSGKTDAETKYTTRSLLGVPVHFENRLLGVLEAVNKVDGDFSEKDREMLQYIARFVSIPLQNAILFKKVLQETREKDRLLELGKTIAYATNVDETLSILKEIVCDIISPTELNVLVNFGEGQQIHRLMGDAEPGSQDPRGGVPIDTTMIGNTNVIFPLKSRERTLGVLEVKTGTRIPETVHSLLRGLAAFVAIMIDKLEMLARIIEKEKLEKELQIARQIQQSFLPSGPFVLPGLDVAAINISSSAVGGDYFDIVPIKEVETIFSINDVSGHGIPASLLMSTFRTNFIYRIKTDPDMMDTILFLNDMLAETTDSNLFVTSFTCRINVETRTLRYINAGHNFPVIIRGDDVLKLSEGSMAVGMFPGIPRETAELEVREGDLLVLYTDGIVEAENAAGDMYGLDRAVEFIRAHRDEPAEAIKKSFLQELRDYSGEHNFEDDLTFILVKILPKKESRE